MARPNIHQLSMRDPAMEALMGVLPDGDFGSEQIMDTGEADFGVDFGGYSFGNDYGYDFGYDFGDDWGAEVAQAAAALPAAHPVNRALARRGMAAGAARVAAHPAMQMVAPGAAIAHPASPAHPANQAAVMSMWNKAQKEQAHTQARESMLEPNKNSKVKVERYGFALNQSLTLNTVLTGFSITGNPDVNIRPQRVTMNAPSPGFVTVTDLRVANVSVTVGGIQDASDYANIAVDAELDLPTLTPANRASFIGNYTGFTPPGFVAGAAFLFAVSFRGPATMAA